MIITSDFDITSDILIGSLDLFWSFFDCPLGRFCYGDLATLTHN